MYFDFSEIFGFVIFFALSAWWFLDDKKSKERSHEAIRYRCREIIDRKLADYCSSEIKAKKFSELKEEIIRDSERVNSDYIAFLGQAELYGFIEEYIRYKKIKIIYD